MALDWSKEISFAGLKNRAPKAKVEYPEKTYMNLAIVDKKTFDVRRNVPIIVALVVILALFLKFGVFDMYGRVGAKQAELAVQQNTLNALTAELANYNEVLAEYEGYESMSISSEGLQIDALDALALVDSRIATRARVSSLALSGNTLSLNLTDITLDGMGKLVSDLYDQSMVSNVAVSTAATEQTTGEDIVASLTITLVPEIE